jgi:hypothetical protein
MLLRGIISTTVVSLVCAVGPISAQQHAAGIWITGGVGAGLTRIHCEICQGDRKVGPSIQLGIGLRLSPKLALGGEAMGWRKKEEDITSSTRTLLAVVYWYPAPDRVRYFLKGGIGAVAYKATANEDDEAEPFRSNTFGVQLGVGYQLRLSRDFSVSPYLSFTGSLSSDLEQGDDRVPDVSHTWIQLGIMIGWR